MGTPHHSGGDSSEVLQKLLGEMDTTQATLAERLSEQLTGRAERAFSEGRISADDDGDLAYAVAAHPKGVVVVDFTKPVEWLGLPPTQARELAHLLIEKAAEVERQPMPEEK